MYIFKKGLEYFFPKIDNNDLDEIANYLNNDEIDFQ